VRTSVCVIVCVCDRARVESALIYRRPLWLTHDVRLPCSIERMCGGGLYVCVSVCGRECVRVCVCACMRV